MIAANVDALLAALGEVTKAAENSKRRLLVMKTASTTLTDLGEPMTGAQTTAALAASNLQLANISTAVNAAIAVFQAESPV